MDASIILANYKYLLPPFVGAAIGWATNYVAIKLLFRPHRPFSLFGYPLQGLIPKRRQEIARSIARAIETELLNSEDIASMLKGVEWEREVEHILEEIVEHRLSSERLRKVPLVGLVSENLSYHLKYYLTKEILKKIDQKKDDLVRRFQDRLNVGELVVSRIDNLDTARFERLLTDFIARELKHLEYLGGVMGFIIGLFQSGIFFILG